MTIPSKKRKPFTRNTFAEHNYNYAHKPRTNQPPPPPPPRKNTQHLNHVFSHYWILPKNIDQFSKFSRKSTTYTGF